jgi:hypothetical protein
MSKLKFNGPSISNTVVPSINLSISNLDAAISINNSMNIPGFSQSGALNEYRSAVSRIRGDLLQLQNWITRSNRTLQTATTRMNTEINGVRTQEIVERGNALN